MCHKNIYYDPFPSDEEIEAQTYEHRPVNGKTELFSYKI